MVWLSLALSAACGGSSKSVTGGDAGESPTGGIGGTSTGGRGGNAAQPTGGFGGTYFDGGTGGYGGTAGHAGAAGASVSGPIMSRAERLTGGSVRVYFENTAGAFTRTCSNESTLVKANGERWIDNRPPCNEPYYLDGVYEENVETFACYGCDNDSCAPFPGYLSFGARDYVQVGFRPAPSNGAGGEAGGSGEAGAGGAPAMIPDIERRAYPGELTLTIHYFTDASCSGRLMTQPPVTFNPAFDTGGSAGASN